ncbi:HET-domain-containing protein [Parathielavia hyrcaniae]|uniref:HET-domain-containing protein n=1 Tax=Parathielavia hyrcaniae TaxID=113614 RepID=A0AAN6PUH1_9PEZI|nr:HET-domain-containing protein [Parathielavia hyrcaniae]
MVLVQPGFDASDIHTNTDRFCDECRQMASITGLSFHRRFSKPGLAGESTMPRRGLMNWRDAPDPKCALCGFLNSELNRGPGEYLFGRVGVDIKGFALPGDAAAKFTDVLRPPVDPASDVVYDKARKWIKTCCSSHKQCRVTGQDGQSFLPTRVIDVGLDDGDALKLHVSAENEQAEYACLSYCWGGGQFKSTCANLEDLTAEIPGASLSQTVADAAEVTRRLGLRYLWVDALCIVQDSDEDKAKHIYTMGAIYKNSTVTIAAATASAASHGFLRAPREPLPTAVVNLPLPNGDIGPVHLTLEELTRQGPWRGKSYHPLDQRGWCLQEHLLSPRLLYFSHWNVEWHCQHGDVQFVYDDLFGKVKSTTPNSFRLEPGIFGAASLGDVAARTYHFGRTHIRLNLWRRIVEDYTGRGLTVPSDRLPALAGITRELEWAWQDECVFGVWKSLAASLLGWQATKRSTRSGMAPTWSWASVSGSVRLAICDRSHNTELELGRISFDGGVQGGLGVAEPGQESGSDFPRLTLTGKVIEPQPENIHTPEESVAWRFDLDEPIFRHEVSHLLLDYHSNLVDRQKRTEMRCIAIRKIEDGVYERVGVVNYEYKRGVLEEDTPWLKLVKEASKVRIQLV